ncbi:MAG: uroporphyrinogen decarboxylase family protein [Spirochaetaceae bacterium]|nr:uroporphyrinogen decarboxylase family protein [Spirochaetaceae bacterium]
MNAKEIIQNTLELKPTPRQAVTVWSGGAWALTSNGISLENALRAESEKVADILFNTYTSVDSDISWAMSGYNNMVVGAIGGKIQFRAKGTPDVVDTLIKNISDISSINIDTIKDDSAVLFMLEVTKHLGKKVDNKQFIALTRWGPWTLAGILYGAENLMRDVYRNPDSVRRLLDFTTNLCLHYMQLYIDNGVNFVVIAEPSASGDMISRKHFQEFVFPVFKKVFTELRSKKVATALHICGNIENRLDLLNGINIDIVSVDYKVSLKKCREVFGGKTAFAGNMDPVGIMQQGTPEAVAAACKQCISDAGEGGGFVLTPGCDIPPSTPIANLKAMSGVVLAHQISH